MFDKLEDLISNDKIITYGVGITTLDEVFLLVARGATGEKAHLQSTEDNGKPSNMIDNDRSVSSNSTKMDLETDE